MAYLIRLFLSILGATCGQRCLDYKQQKHQFTEPSCQSLPYCYDYSPKRTVVSLFPDILNHNKIDIQCKMRLFMNIIERSVCYDNSRCWPIHSLSLCVKRDELFSHTSDQYDLRFSPFNFMHAYCKGILVQLFYLGIVSRGRTMSFLVVSC